MSTVSERLKALQITLPDAPRPVVDGYVASFVPFVRTGNLVYLSGRLAKQDGKIWSGKLGEQITTSDGKQAARGIAIELLATLQAALGDSRASELFLDIFGERGAHARSAFGVTQIPFGSCVEIEMVVETFRSDSLCEA
jgi:enamine deaminase RidA (YjgF/YER057c/UK114 family)